MPQIIAVSLVVTGASAMAVADSSRPIVVDLGTDMWETDVPEDLLPAYYNVQADHDEDFGKYLANQGLALDTSYVVCFGKGEVHPCLTPVNGACVAHSHLLCRVCLLNNARVGIKAFKPTMARHFSCSSFPAEQNFETLLCPQCISAAPNWYQELRQSTTYQVKSTDDFWELARVRQSSSGIPIGRAYWRDMFSINESRNGSVEWLFVSSDIREMGCMRALYMFGKRLTKYYDPITSREACELYSRDIVAQILTGITLLVNGNNLLLFLMFKGKRCVPALCAHARPPLCDIPATKTGRSCISKCGFSPSISTKSRNSF
jgi:hypothetical protein